MTLAHRDSPTQITVVTAPGCHFCEEAQDVLSRLHEQGHRLEVHLVEAASAEGAALLATHRPAMNPLVLLGGQYFSAGRLPRRKLEAYLRQDARVLKVDSRG